MCKAWITQTHWVCFSLTSGFDCNIEKSKLTRLASATSSAILFPSASQYQKALHQNQLSQLSTAPLICGDTGTERGESGQRYTSVSNNSHEL